jgi:uncharacterized protein YutE (UPF0331/DUF86 family)
MTEKQALLTKRATILQKLEAHHKGTEIINQEHQDALEATRSALERIKKIKLSPNSKSNKELRHEAIRAIEAAIDALQAIRKKEKRGNESYVRDMQ